MLLRKSSLARTIICLVLFFNLAAAGVVLRRQQDDNSPSTIAEQTRTPDPEPTQTSTPSSSDDDRNEESEPLSRTTTAAAPNNSTATTTTAEPTQTGSNLEDLLSNNSTIPEGELPLKPELTPGWGVAGIVLLITGLGYALIGIKNQWVHVFLSCGYLSGLATAVLIIYLMTVPVSTGIQAAYVVACILTGIALGGGALVLKEITESLGCMLGGFCFGMWMLTLVEGGLLAGTANKTIFLCVFTCASFALYLSHWTRAYGLIGSISFSGATAVILGIDCFSRAGLKEFWAYIWSLNEELFPVGTTTYPITKGMRAQSAIIIIIFLVGIASQMKLWKVIEERREKRALKLASHRRNMEKEDEAVGRQIEAQNQQERRQWEAVHGDGPPLSPTGMGSSGDSGVATSVVGDKRVGRASHSTEVSRQAADVDIEMANMQSTDNPDQLPAHPEPKPKTAAEVVSEVNPDGTVTVRVAADDMPTGPVPEDEQEKVWIVGPDGNPIPASTAPKSPAARSSAPPPVVVPLPFSVPEATEEDKADTKSNANRSSIATFNDGEADDELRPTPRDSMVKRLSQPSLSLLRKISQRKVEEARSKTPVDRDELMVAQQEVEEEDRRSSLAATVDGLSSDGDMDSVRGMNVIEINADLGDRTTEDSEPATPTASKERPVSTASLAPGDAMGERSTVGAKSATGSETLAPASLTKEKLPRAMSRVMMSYRTNEWAKHLSHAATPEPDSLQLNDYLVQETGQKAEKAKETEEEADSEEAKKAEEPAAPVDLQDLQRTAGSGVPSPSAATMPERSLSQNSSLPTGPSSQRVVSQQITEQSGTDPYQTLSPRTSMSSQAHQSTSPHSVPGVVSYSSPQTLIGQREILMRNKSMGPASVAGEPMSSDTASVYSQAVYGASPYTTQNADDLPLSKRRELMMRQGSLQALGASGIQQQTVSNSYGMLQPVAAASTPALPAESVAFDSHQPNRDNSGVASLAAREARLSSFRQSVAQDLRKGSAIVPSAATSSNPYTNGSLLSGGGLVGTGRGGSMVNLTVGEAAVRSSINAQRNALMSQKQVEMQQAQAERANKERQNQAFEQKMRSGALIDAHREAMRRMQGKPQ